MTAVAVTNGERTLPDTDGRPPLLPSPPPVRPPSAATVWSRALVLAAVLLAWELANRAADLLMQLWLLESLGLESVFWTNFRMGAALFAGALLAFTAAIAAPAWLAGLSSTARRRALGVGLLAGVVGGVVLAGRHPHYLLALHGRSFERADPVFGHDIGFYVFILPAIWTTLHAALAVAAAGLASAVTCALLDPRPRHRPDGMRRLWYTLGRVASRPTIVFGAALVVLFAATVWLQRYDVLRADNTDSSIPAGAQALDVTGVFSTVNLLTVEALAALALGVGLTVLLAALRDSVRRPGARAWRRRTTRSGLALLLLPGVALSLAFEIAAELRDEVEIEPNEPVVQLPFIERHVGATNAAYGMDTIERRTLVPNGPGDPLPDVEELLRHPTIRNAPLWPGYHKWLESQLDPEYLERIPYSPEDSTIYGPTLDAYRQQQKLRPYYDFMDIDTVRYEIGGEPRLFASSVRELPLLEPQPWLAWWGQRFVVFTHGSGLVMSPLAGVDPQGAPVYASGGIPSRTTAPELSVDNPAVYYGEGAGTMAYSNVAGVDEHDLPTDTGRAEVSYPADVDAGVRIDSLLKRAVFGYKSGQLLEILFSDLVTDATRVHYFRTPLERLDRVAPFLYADTDPYAVAAGERVTWMLNGLTTTDRYPYAMPGELGDKSARRTPTPRPPRVVNYAADSVKATLDAYTGAIALYRWRSEPVVDTWADVYPGLFAERSEMPPPLRAQVQYPLQLMHLQFDDLYVYTHMTDPLTYFSQEDLFDDGDEVLGPLLTEGEAVNFSIEPYSWLAETGGPLPRAAPATQFALSAVFTPENALNLRAIVTAYQDGEDYGRLSLLEVPKGRFFPGPEQADAAIDQDPFISQQIGLWSRRGLEVIRGHTTPLLVDRELLYVEPLFVRSRQNPVPQLARVVVVFRGAAFMGRDLAAALRAAVEPRRAFPIRPGPELGGG
jgi:uncharacterized membrane protein (UPF0182 family)